MVYQQLTKACEEPKKAIIVFLTDHVTKERWNQCSVAVRIHHLERTVKIRVSGKLKMKDTSPTPKRAAVTISRAKPINLHATTIKPTKLIEHHLSFEELELKEVSVKFR